MGQVLTRNVREHIHHGDYVNDRWMEVELTPAGIAKLLAGSPYNSGLKEDDPRLIELADKLFHVGYAQFGWADYRVVFHADPEVESDPAGGYICKNARQEVYTANAEKGLIMISPTAADDGYGASRWDVIDTVFGEREASMWAAERGEPVEESDYTAALTEAGWEVISEWKPGLYKVYAFVTPVQEPAE